MRQMKLKLKYSERMMYFCLLCGSPFSVAVHQHFAELHDMHNPVDNMNFVQIVMVNSNGGQQPRLKSPSELGPWHLDHRTPTPSESSRGSSPHSPNPTGKAFDSKQTNVLGLKVLPGQNTHSENLLLKMEQLVKTAFDKESKTAEEQKPNCDIILPLPPSNNNATVLKKHK